jgi:hypothetical protein
MRKAEVAKERSKLNSQLDILKSKLMRSSEMMEICEIYKTIDGSAENLGVMLRQIFIDVPVSEILKEGR